LVFCALVEFAQAALEERGVEPDFGPSWDRAFDDLEVKTLFDASHAVEPRLEFREWFARSTSARWCIPRFAFRTAC
jgi:hypothetical protein